MSIMISSPFDVAYLDDVEILSNTDEADQGHEDRRWTTNEDQVTQRERASCRRRDEDEYEVADIPDTNRKESHASELLKRSLHCRTYSP